MLGTEGTMSTPTLNTNSTVWYYGTTTAGTLKNWAYKNLTINSASTTNVFSFPSAIAATTTTITSGVLYTAGYNFTGVNFINDATFRLKGSETITITNGMDTDSGTVEYVGDGDSVADNFYNQILGFYNLTVNQTDLADALRLSSFSTSTSFMANFDDVPVSNGFIDYSMYNKPVYISGATHSTSSGYLNTGGLTFDGNDLATSSVVTASGNYSWSARVKRLVDTGTYEQIIGINTTDFNSNNGMYIDYNGANDNKVGCYIQPSGTTAWVIYSTSSIPVGSWRTIQCVLTGSELAVWVNGVKENSTNAVSGSLVAGKSFIFGRNGNGNQRYLNGVLDDVQIINRAISTAEIAAINQASAADLNPWLINGSLAIQRGVTYLPLTLSLVRDLTVGVNSFLSATSTTINLTGTDQTITLSATTTFATLTKTLGVGSTTNQTLYFSNASNTPLIITGTTTLSGVSGDGLTLFLRSLASTTPWYFDPQATSSRVFAYIDVQDSTNINATEIDSDNITGYVDSGRNVGWGGASAVITVSKSGTQVATTTTPVDDLALGGAFVFNTTNGDAVISSIKIKQAGSVATTSLTNIRLAYKQEETCSSTTPAGTTAFGNAGSFDANNYATTTGTMSLSEGSPVCLYITYDLIGTPGTSTLGRTIDFEIANPSTDILSADGLATPATHINITGRTMVVDPDYVLSMISLHVSDPTKDPTIYYWKDNAVWKREGNGTAIRLTNPNLQVHNLSFTDLTGPNSNGVVRMEITISNMDPGEEGVFLNVTRTLQTTAGVRARF
jgi:hypothetical protein